MLRGHLVKCENSLGRSTVIDLSSKSDNKFRQVDHRTIEYIILRNVKFVLKKGTKKSVNDAADDEDDKKKADEPKWDTSKLAVDNWFSNTKYYKGVKKTGGDIEMEG